jgi:hypothetical protein
VFEAEIVVIEAANEIDMLTAGEFRYSGRTDAIGDDDVARIAHVCQVLGVEGLLATLLAARERERGLAVPAALQTGVHASYRLASSGEAAMASGTGALAAA